VRQNSPASGKVKVADGAKKADWIEAVTVTDADGKEISVLLHVDRHGFMNMLEILKYDPAPIISPPTAGNLMVLRES